MTGSDGAGGEAPGAVLQRPDRTIDTLVIGGGAAGFRAALEAVRHGAVLVLTKDAIRESNTNYAQGGMAAVLAEDDSLQSHEEDTLRAGAGLCESRAVRAVVEEGPARIAELEQWGAIFDREGVGLSLGREGGHSRNRVVHARGDATGAELQDTLVARVRAEPGIEVVERAFVTDLLVQEGRCVGAAALDAMGGPLIVGARNTILCTGGAGQLYRETTNPPIATGDGVAMAWRAGSAVADLEFVQFHPTTLYVAGSSRQLITEAVRGEGGYLVDRKGERFVFRYHPDGELAPRDVVSRAIVEHIGRSGAPCVFLDLRHLGVRSRVRFPGLNRLCGIYGLDLTRDLIPVHPSAHYMVGGVLTDLDGRTDLPGLYAAGEVAVTGLHGANRLASNSLIEGLVFGRRAGEHAALAGGPVLERVPVRRRDEPLPPEVLQVPDMLNSVKSLMWRSVGIVRTGEGLREALAQLTSWRAFASQVRFSAAPGLELENILTVAVLVARGALWREESRGTHQRSDFPERSDARFGMHSTQTLDGGLRATPLR